MNNFDYETPYTEQKILLEEHYKPSQKTMEFIWLVYEKFIKWRSLKEQTYKQFNSQNLLSYINDARQKFWGFSPLSYDVDTPQFFFPETRNQIISILSKIANYRIKPTFEGMEGLDIIKGTILEDLFEYWKRSANRKLDNFYQFLYNIVNGTVVVFAAYNSRVREVKTITMHDPKTGKTKYKTQELDESDVKETIVNLEDLYIPKMWEPSIQEQEEVIWRTLMKWADFKNAFCGYANADVVIPGQQFSDSSIFADFLSYDVKGADFVEVIKYFNAPKDQYAIIANGVLLNPLINADGEEEVGPLPWNHKKLPFAKTVFEPIENNFFYGMPLAQKVRDPQQALNTMWELMLDRERRSNAAPIITNDSSVENGLEFKAGRIYQVQGDVAGYKELQVAPTSNSFWNVVNTLDGLIKSSAQGGVGPVLQGRQPRSATENAVANQEKKEALGLYSMFYKDLLEQKVWLVIKNMIQFYTTHKVRKILGDREYFKIIHLANTDLFQGGLGDQEIRITKKPHTSNELMEESYMRSLLKKEKVEIIEVTPESLQAIDFDIKVDFELENSPADERALYLDYITTMFNLFGPAQIISPKKAFFRLSEKFNENPSDLVDDNLLQEYEHEAFGTPLQKQQQPGMQGGTQGGNPMMPTAQAANQQSLGARVGAQGGMQNIQR